MKGRRILEASWATTAVFAAVTGLAAAGVDAFDYASVVVPLTLFAASLPIFLYALARGAMRSARHGERITVSGLFCSKGSAPPAVRRALFGSLATTVVVAAATASIQPYGILVPVFPVSLCGLWSARHGTFPPIPGEA